LQISGEPRNDPAALACFVKRQATTKQCHHVGLSCKSPGNRKAVQFISRGLVRPKADLPPVQEVSERQP
jgi:hypothetical protein